MFCAKPVPFYPGDLTASDFGIHQEPWANVPWTLRVTCAPVCVTCTYVRKPMSLSLLPSLRESQAFRASKCTSVMPDVTSCGFFHMQVIPIVLFCFFHTNSWYPEAWGCASWPEALGSGATVRFLVISLHLQKGPAQAECLGDGELC